MADCHVCAAVLVTFSWPRTACFACGGCSLVTGVQAWYREGSAARILEDWEAAAQAYFEAYRLDPSNETLAVAFQDAIRQGQAVAAAKEPQ